MIDERNGAQGDGVEPAMPPPSPPKTEIGTPLKLAMGLLALMVVYGVITSVMPSGTDKAEASAEAQAEDAAPVAMDPDLPPAPNGMTPEQMAAVNAVSKQMKADREGRGAKPTIRTLRGMLTGVSMAQEVQMYDRHSYVDNIAKLPDLPPHAGVTVTILEGTNAGWSAKASATNVKGICVAFIGQVKTVPVTNSGKRPPPQGGTACDE